MTKREFLVTTIEERRYRVDYVVKAADEASAQRLADDKSAKVIDESSQLESIISSKVISVEVNK